MRIPLEKPSPDFDSLTKVLKGEMKPERVHFVELGLDHEVIRAIMEDSMNWEWTPSTEETTEAYQRQLIQFWYRMGYDFFPVSPDWLNLPEFRRREAQDTAGLSKGKRTWIEEGGGIIKNWDDFQKVGWERIGFRLQTLEYAEAHLPDGMKITIGCTLFEMIMEWFLGYEDLFVLSIEDPGLVEAVFEHWGQKIYDVYKDAIQHPKVGGIFHPDDLGHRTGTMLSPEFLRKNVFPWLKKYAALAHEQGKVFWYHCCGNVLDVMEDLIEDVRIDAFHSFQDLIIPVGEFMRRYGDRIATLGGVDMDKLARMPEPALRQYVRETLDECMPGRYALGSGNSIANYIPVHNYLVMLDEGLQYAG